MGSNFKHKLRIAMSLFKPDAEKTLQKNLDTAKSIAARLVTAKTLLAEHHATANELARDNADDATLDQAERRIRVAQIRVDALGAALTETDQQILQLEQELAADAGKKQREAAAFEIEKTAEGFASAAADTLTSLNALALHAEAMARFLPDAADLHSFASRARAELPGSIEMLLTLARRYTDAVLAGHNKATVPAPEAAAAEVQTQPAPTARIFTVRDVAWTDAAGTTETSGRYFDIDLPAETATRALRQEYLPCASETRVGQALLDKRREESSQCET
jgi:hypothetical protein